MIEQDALSTGAPLVNLDQVGDALDVGMLGVDRQLVVTMWNHWLESATGRNAADVIGRPLDDLGVSLAPAARSALERAVGGTMVVLSQRLHGYLIEIPAPSGYEHVCQMQQSVRILPVAGADGQPAGALALIRDVTERVAQEAELRSAMESAQQANRAKSDFLAAMSHDLRTPIGAMLAYADLLAEGIFGTVTDVQREKLLRIKQVGAQLVSIVDEILTFARIEAGREPVHRESFDASQLVRDAVLSVEPQAASKKLELVCRYPDRPLSIDTDVMKVRQILVNLLGNAVKFTDHGRITVEIVDTDPEKVSFVVADTGPGISEEDQRRVFDSFVQGAQSASRAQRGSGLGLSVSRSLARLLGGDVSLRSTPGRGSEFTVTLPRSAPPRSP
jgi:signal transduction histidine kinase